MSLIPSISTNVDIYDRSHYKLRVKIFTCLCTWELYPLLLIASILRLGWLNTTPFAGDQSALYQLAYDAVHRGLIPATSNNASIFTMHAPLTIYFLILPVLFSSDPLWAAVMTALFNVIAVLLTYIFTRRYYGRTAAVIATMLFATAQTTIVFSRFIWQPTLLSFFVLLFLFALFRGVVERRKGWLFPALVLLGIMYQLHEITLLMAALLCAALLLVPHTIRLHDITLGLVCLLLLFVPYLVWEINSKFADIYILYSLAQNHAHIDSKAITYYLRFLNAYYYDDRSLGSTYYDPVGATTSAVFMLLPLLRFVSYIMYALLVGAGTLAAMSILHPTDITGTPLIEAPTTTSQKPLARILHIFITFYRWWQQLRANPFRCGLLLLLLWQIVPVFSLLRHTASIHQHYLLMVLPGQFILIGWFLSRAISWLQTQYISPQWQRLHYVAYAFTAFLLAVQLLGSAASLFDTIHGINNHIFGYNDLGSLQHAVQEADSVAQTHHLNRVYIAISSRDDSLTSLPYLASQMQTPSTLFDASNCLILPSLASGPAVFLLHSTDTVAAKLLSLFALTILVDKPPLLGTSPFLLYIVTPLTEAQTHVPSNGFVHHLQLLDTHIQQFTIDTSFVLATRWTLLQNTKPVSFKTYTYILRARPSSVGTRNIASLRSDCLFTASRADDELIASFYLPHSANRSSSFNITSQLLITSPYTFTQGPLHFETFRMNTAYTTLHTANGSDTLTISNDT